MTSPAGVRPGFAPSIDGADPLLSLHRFHRALADVTRLRILRRLAAGPATVTELIAHVGRSQPLVSWHVRRLRIAGIVATRRAGRETVCSLRSEVFVEMADRERALLGLGDGGSR